MKLIVIAKTGRKKKLTNIPKGTLEIIKNAIDNKQKYAYIPNKLMIDCEEIFCIQIKED